MLSLDSEGELALDRFTFVCCESLHFTQYQFADFLVAVLAGIDA